MEYTVDYFIDKFSTIDSDDIGVGSLCEHCSLYHCGVVEDVMTGNYLETEESIALGKLINNHLNDKYNEIGAVYNLNDGHIVKYQQETPKERILACLNDIKAKQTQ